MGLLDTNKTNISFKKLLGKAHTQENFAVSEESIASNVTLSSSSIFGESINANPISSGLTNLYDTDGIIERVKFEIEIIPDTQIGTNQSQGYRLKLPADYSANGALNGSFSSGDFLHTSLGKLQIVPSSFGELKGDGSTEFDPILYKQDGNTIITKFDSINWSLDYYSGILFIQNPPSGFDVSVNRPGYVTAYLYVGKYLSEISNSIIKDTVFITGGTYQATNSNDNILCTSGCTINLPDTPSLHKEIRVVDSFGGGETSNIIIDGNGKLIIDDNTATINTNYGSITFLYNGTFWNIINFT